MGERVSIRGRHVKIVHLKLFSVHRDDVSFGMTGHRLFVERVNLPFHDLILSLPIRPDQTTNVPENMRKIVQVNPKQAPNDGEYSRDPAFQSIVFPLKHESGHTPDQSTDADEQSKTCVCKNSVTARGDLKQSHKVGDGQNHFGRLWWLEVRMTLQASAEGGREEKEPMFHHANLAKTSSSRNSKTDAVMSTREDLRHRW